LAKSVSCVFYGERYIRDCRINIDSSRGIVWELFPGTLFYAFLKMGTFNPITWFATFLLATGVTTAIEVLCLVRIFEVPGARRTWGLWFLANTVSVGLAFLSFFVSGEAIDSYRPWLFG
jgi:hypothetical protein